MVDSDERTRLVTSHDAASNAYDKTLLTLTSGALGLSIAFVKDIVEQPTHRWLLLACWVGLGVCLLVQTASHAISVEIHKRYIKAIDEGPPEGGHPWWVRNLATWMNRVSGALFATGVAFLIAFAFINFDHP